MSAEVSTHVMSLDQARRVTERIRIQATNYLETRQKLEATIEEAKTGRAWDVLGYPSWTAYLSDALGDEPLRLSRDERREVVELLAGEGMSTRAIAPIVGVTHKTVVKDSQATREVVPEVPPAPNASVVSVFGPVAQESTSGKTADGTAKVAVPGSQDGEDHMGASDVGDGHVDPSDISRPAVTGMDGKTYTRTWPTPTPEKPRRTPLIKTIESALLDLDRRSTTLLNSLEDDRWDGIKNQVTSTRASDLDRIIDRLTTVRQSLSN